VALQQHCKHIGHSLSLDACVGETLTLKTGDVATMSFAAPGEAQVRADSIDAVHRPCTVVCSQPTFVDICTRVHICGGQ